MDGTGVATPCPDCHGKGWTYVSCCTGRPTEHELCPKCGEPLAEETCETCEGSGGVVECEDCNGTGEIERTIHKGDEGMKIEMDVPFVCGGCNGKGTIPVLQPIVTN